MEGQWYRGGASVSKNSIKSHAVYQCVHYIRARRYLYTMVKDGPNPLIGPCYFRVAGAAAMHCLRKRQMKAGKGTDTHSTVILFISFCA
jgi:hypothetical protein